MTLNEYQQKAIVTNLKKEDKVLELIQQVLGLGDEAGEVQAIFKKWIRDDMADFEKLDVTRIKKELGDVLWYVSVVAHDVGLDLDDIAQSNVDKLADRQKRGVLGGSGDNR
jgi:NTP pyrophosphatase (non-canonical NTP hydrolase)